MALSELPARTLPSTRPTRVGQEMLSLILSVFLMSQLTVVLRGADKSDATHGCSSQPDFTAEGGAGSACPDMVKAEETKELEHRMFELINRERADPSHLAETQGRARPLKWDDLLAEVARAHSRDMVARSYVGHLSPDGSFPALRVSQAGIPYSATAENVAKFRDIFRAHAAFMSEPPNGHNHRANILDPDFTYVGIGIVRGADGMYYITQEFVGRP